jgi:hypothetical protein
MKVLLTADWHIKLTSKDIPKEWQKQRYKMLIDTINKKPHDYIVIMGDFFDKVPNIEELDFGISLLCSLSKPVYIFDGNHEATKKGETFLSHKFFSLFNSITIITEPTTILDTFQVIPYNSLRNIESIPKTKDLLLTHVRGEILPHVKPEIPLSVFNRWSHVYAGDLHFQHTQQNITYPGTPISNEFKRSDKYTGSIILYDTELSTSSVVYLPELPQLYLRSINTGEDIVEDSFDHVMYDVKGNIGDIKSMNHSLIKTKKAITNEEAAIQFSSDMDIHEELNVYMSSILSLDRETLDSTMDIFFKEVEPEYYATNI